MKLTDLHCHILPNIDDGAKNMEASIKLLQQEHSQGVLNIAFTPHFSLEKQSVAQFLNARNKAAKLLAAQLKLEGIDFQKKLGAEVMYSPNLVNHDLKPLCLQGTSYLLIELSPLQRPQNLRDFIYELQMQGYAPILAHVERYSYLMNNPNEIYELVEAGVIIQVNAASILREEKQRKQIFKLMRSNLVHIIASDAHSPSRRPSMMAKAFQCIELHFGKPLVFQLEENAKNVFLGKDVSFNTFTS